MAVQQFCLRWNNHQPNFISVFSSLLNSESLVDVTLAAEGRHLQAHKVVLSACSSYFQSLFMVNPCQHPIVILKDVKFIDLKVMVDFMYYGEVNVSQEQLPHILKTAEMLKIKGLAEMPDSTSLTKSSQMQQHQQQQHQQSATDKPELLTPNESNWSSSDNGGNLGSNTQRLGSPPPLSPGTRRKRFRKTSSGSTDRQTSDDLSGVESGPQQLHPMIGGMITGGVTKSEYSSTETSTTTSHILKQHSSTDSDVIRTTNTSSQESMDEQQQQRHVTLMHSDLQTVVQQQSIETPMIEMGDPSTSQGCVQQTPVHHPGVQWTLVEHTAYHPRFALPSTTSSSQDSSNGGGGTTQPPPPTTHLHNTSSPPTMYHHHHHIPQHFTQPSETTYQQQPIQQPNAGAPASPCPSICPSPSSSSCPPASPTTQAPPPKRKRSINPQADENFVRALEAVRFGGIGFCKAARMFGVNNRTLWLEYKKRGYPNTRPSIKNRVKQEVPTTPSPKASPSDSIGGGDVGHGSTSTVNLEIPSPHMLCPPGMGGVLGSFLDGRHVEFNSGGVTAGGGNRAQGTSVLTTAAPSPQTHINLHGIHFNSM